MMAAHLTPVTASAANFEAHALDAPTAKEIPKRMIGRTLTLEEAAG